VGSRNVVASLGTALTKEHVDLIRRYTNEVIVLFDPDVAGKKALARSIELFLSGNVHAKAIVLPEGYDPDQYVRTYGNEALAGIIGRAQSMVDYYIENFIGRVSTVEEKRDALREAISFIVNIDNISERDLFIRRVSEKLGLNQELLTKEINRAVKTQTIHPVSTAREPDVDIDTVELSLIHIMLEYPLKMSEIVRQGILDFFMSTNLQSIAKRLKDSIEKDGSEGFDASLFIQNIEHDAIRQKLLKKMIDENPYDEGIIDRIIKDTLKQIKRKWYKEKRRMLTTEIKKADEGGNHELSNRLLVEKERLLREEKALQ
jgi:DNA primase